jgi:peptide/nickel transport system permease protein
MSTALIRLLLRRLLNSLPLIFIVVSVTFLLIRLAPGDPAYVLAGSSWPESARFTD